MTLSCRTPLDPLPLVALVAALLPATALATRPCTVPGVQALAPEGTVIDSAEALAAPVPHCKIDGHIITDNPGPNRVNFRLQLPDEGWQKRYFFIGMGGAAGSVPTHSGVPAGSPMLKGFAVAGTDTGRQGHMLDWSFLRDNPAQVEDHVHRAMHVSAGATQAITRRWYNSDTLFRYMSGCSGGGRMATESITRHPEDFDGVLLGAPGGRSSATMMTFIHNAQQMNREPGACDNRFEAGEFRPGEALGVVPRGAGQAVEIELAAAVIGDDVVHGTVQAVAGGGHLALHPAQFVR